MDNNNGSDVTKKAVLEAVEKCFGTETRRVFEEAVGKTLRVPEWYGVLSSCNLRDFIGSVSSLVAAEETGANIEGVVPDPELDEQNRLSNAKDGVISGSRYLVRGVFFSRKSPEVVTGSYHKRGASVVLAEKEKWAITISEYSEEHGITLIENDSFDHLSEALLCAATKMVSA